MFVYQLRQEGLPQNMIKERQVTMTVSAHIDALHQKHAHLENCILDEQSRPMPDFASISALKKRKLRIKEELESLEAPPQRRASA